MTLFGIFTTEVLIALIVVCFIGLAVLVYMKWFRNKESTIVHSEAVKPIDRYKPKKPHGEYSEKSENEEEPEDVPIKSSKHSPDMPPDGERHYDLAASLERINRRLDLLETPSLTRSPQPIPQPNEIRPDEGHIDRSFEGIMERKLTQSLNEAKVSFILTPKNKTVKIGNTVYDVEGRFVIGDQEVPENTHGDEETPSHGNSPTPIEHKESDA